MAEKVAAVLSNDMLIVHAGEEVAECAADAEAGEIAAMALNLLEKVAGFTMIDISSAVVAARG